MKAASRSACWLPGSSLAKLIVACVAGIIRLPAQPAAQMQFVKLVSERPPAYAAPVELIGADRVALRLSGLDAQNSVSLRVYGLLNRSADRAYESNQTALLATLDLPALKARNLATGTGDFLIPLPEVRLPSVLELTASLTAAGIALGPPASLTIGSRAVPQSAPSWLLSVTSSLFDRIVNLYQVFREEPEPSTIYTVALKEGAAVSEPVMLPLDRARYRTLALSPAGDRLAWVTQRDDGYELWTSPLDDIRPEKVFASPAPILTPSFASADVLLFIADDALRMTRLSRPASPLAVSMPFRKVLRVDAAWTSPDSLDGIVSAVHPDTPDLELPYRIHLPLSGAQPTAFRLSQSPLYRSLSMLVRGVPLFYAGTEDGVEGIYYVKPGDPGTTVRNLCKVHRPAALALAAGGGRLAFTGNP